MARTAASAEPAAVRTARIVSRLVAAGVGGYALASAVAMALPLILPLRRADGVLTASLVAIAVYVGAIIWVYSVRRLSVVWAGVALPAALLAAVGYALRGGGAG